MINKEKRVKIATNMIKNNPRMFEYSMELFKHAVKAQEGIELTDEDALSIIIEIGKLIIRGGTQ